jgi:hypothetical protein
MAMVIDGWGNLYVTGISDGGVTGCDVATMKYGMALLPQRRSSCW